MTHNEFEACRRTWLATKATCEGERWIFTLDAGLRFLGKVTSFHAETRSFTLQPVFEYMTQIKITCGSLPQREEAVVAVDMIGTMPVHVTPAAFLWVDQLPEWRQKEIQLLVDEGLKSAEAFAARKRSGLVIVGP